MRLTADQANSRLVNRLMCRQWALVALAAVAIAALVLGGLRIAVVSGRAASDERVAQLATLAGAVKELMDGMQDEQDDLAVYVAQGRPAGAAALLLPQGQESVTNLAATDVLDLARGIGAGFAPSVRSAVAAVLGAQQHLSAIRAHATGGQAAALQVIESYSQAEASLVDFDGQLATGTGDAVIAGEARALSALSRAEYDASQERAILDAALTAGQIQPGEAQALSAANSGQRAALASFERNATPAQRRSYAAAMTGRLAGDAAQMLSEALADGSGGLTVVNPPGSAFITAPQSWRNDMTFTVDQMRGAEQQLLSTIEKQSQARGAQASGAIADTWLEMGGIVIVVAALAAFVIVSRWRSLPASPAESQLTNT